MLAEEGRSQGEYESLVNAKREGRSNFIEIYRSRFRLVFPIDDTLSKILSIEHNLFHNRQIGILGEVKVPSLNLFYDAKLEWDIFHTRRMCNDHF